MLYTPPESIVMLNSSIMLPEITSDLFFNVNGNIIQAKAKFHNPKSITIPTYIGGDFISFIAYALSESYHTKNRIIFSNTNPLLLSHFQFLAKKLFNLEL